MELDSFANAFACDAPDDIEVDWPEDFTYHHSTYYSVSCKHMLKIRQYLLSWNPR